MENAANKKEDDNSASTDEESDSSADDTESESETEITTETLRTSKRQRTKAPGIEVLTSIATSNTGHGASETKSETTDWRDAIRNYQILTPTAKLCTRI